MQHVFIDTKICLIELQYIFTKKYIYWVCICNRLLKFRGVFIYFISNLILY